jgi:hypothetical protein
MGTVFSLFPDRKYTSWMVKVTDLDNWCGVSHVEDLGVEMLWLACTPTTTSEGPDTQFKVSDVLALPSNYRSEGLTVIPCRGGAQGNAVVVLGETETRKVVRAWTVDVTTATFAEIDPAAAKWTPLLIREDD